jgi:hypothetical protein
VKCSLDLRAKYGILNMILGLKEADSDPRSKPALVAQWFRRNCEATVSKNVSKTPGALITPAQHPAKVATAP